MWNGYRCGDVRDGASALAFPRRWWLRSSAFESYVGVVIPEDAVDGGSSTLVGRRRSLGGAERAFVHARCREKNRHFHFKMAEPDRGEVMRSDAEAEDHPLRSATTWWSPRSGCRPYDLRGRGHMRLKLRAEAGPPHLGGVTTHEDTVNPADFWSSPKKERGPARRQPISIPHTYDMGRMMLDFSEAACVKF